MESRFEEITVGFIGIGKMGYGMAKNVLTHKYPLVVWNRTPQKYEDHIELNATPAATPRELAERADVILSMLSTPAVTLDVLLGNGDWQSNGVLDGVKEGSVVIDMSTNLPRVAQRLAQKFLAKGVDFVDAPVIGSVKPALAGTLTILAAGKRDIVEKVTPILEAVSARIWYIGETGTGCSMKLTMNLHLNLVTGAFAESLVFGVKAGLDPSLIVDIWNNTIFKTYITETKGPKVLQGDWSPAFAIDMAAKDINLAAEIAQEVSAPIPLGSVVKQLLAASIANGKKDWDLCALVTLYEQLANVKVTA